MGDADNDRKLFAAIYGRIPDEFDYEFDCNPDLIAEIVRAFDEKDKRIAELEESDRLSRGMLAQQVNLARDAEARSYEFERRISALEVRVDDFGETLLGLRRQVDEEADND